MLKSVAWRKAALLAFLVLGSAREAAAEMPRGLEYLFAGGEILIPDLGLTVERCPHVLLGFPLQFHVWKRKAKYCDESGCRRRFKPWVAFLTETQWVPADARLALFTGPRAYVPLSREHDAPSLSLDVVGVGSDRGLELAFGLGLSKAANPQLQGLTPRYRFVLASEPRHEITIDLISFTFGAE